MGSVAAGGALTAVAHRIAERRATPLVTITIDAATSTRATSSKTK